jgi:hypothetical protein
MVVSQWPGVGNFVRGKASADEVRRLHQSSIGILVVILVIGWMTIFKPGHS